jgi:hypothetical protein
MAPVIKDLNIRAISACIVLSYTHFSRERPSLQAPRRERDLQAQVMTPGRFQAAT